MEKLNNNIDCEKCAVKETIEHAKKEIEKMWVCNRRRGIENYNSHKKYGCGIAEQYHWINEGYVEAYTKLCKEFSQSDLWTMWLDKYGLWERDECRDPKKENMVGAKRYLSKMHLHLEKIKLTQLLDKCASSDKTLYFSLTEEGSGYDYCARRYIETDEKIKCILCKTSSGEHIKSLSEYVYIAVKDDEKEKK